MNRPYLDALTEEDIISVLNSPFEPDDTSAKLSSPSTMTGFSFSPQSRTVTIPAPSEPQPTHSFKSKGSFFTPADMANMNFSPFSNPNLGVFGISSDINFNSSPFSQAAAASGFKTLNNSYDISPPMSPESSSPMYSPRSPTGGAFLSKSAESVSPNFMEHSLLQLLTISSPQTSPREEINYNSTAAPISSFNIPGFNMIPSPREEFVDQNSDLGSILHDPAHPQSSTLTKSGNLREKRRCLSNPEPIKFAPPPSKSSKLSKTVKDNSSNEESWDKSSHSEMERRRRQKMNDSIEELKQLLPPEMRKQAANKLAVIEVGVDYVNQLNDRMRDLKAKQDNLDAMIQKKQKEIELLKGRRK